MVDLKFEWDEQKELANLKKNIQSKVGMMRDEYDFSNAIKNPYAKRLKKQLTIRLDEDTVQYFKTLSSEVSIPYQTLINLYLRDCAQQQKKLTLAWAATG